MPPKKSTAKPIATAAVASEVVHHKTAFFAALSAKIKEVGAKGHDLVVGIKSEGDEDEDEDEEEDENKVYTKEQIDSLRVILVNDRRISEINKARKKITGGQDGGFMMFDTETGNVTIMEILRLTKAAKAKKTLPEKFDCLFGLTHQLIDFDSWAQDNEMWGPGGELEKAILGLGKAWSDLLSHTDAELGIDAEYTRPGIEALLDKFAETFNDVLAASDTAPFEWDDCKDAAGTSKSSSKRKASSEDA